MPTLKPTPRTAARRIGPILIAADLARETRRHWQEQLRPAERERLVALLRSSRGLPRNLTPRERRDVARLVKRLDVPSFAKHATTTVVTGRKPKHRGR